MVNKFYQGRGKFENLETKGHSYEKYFTQAEQPLSSLMVCV